MWFKHHNSGAASSALVVPPEFTEDQMNDGSSLNSLARKNYVNLNITENSFRAFSPLLNDRRSKNQNQAAPTRGNLQQNKKKRLGKLVDMTQSSHFQNMKVNTFSHILQDETSIYSPSI